MLIDFNKLIYCFIWCFKHECTPHPYILHKCRISHFSYLKQFLTRFRYLFVSNLLGVDYSHGYAVQHVLAHL